MIHTQPQLVVSKRATLLKDTFENVQDQGKITPGDSLSYALAISNQGDRTASDVTIEDQPDPNTQLLTGTVQASLGTILTGNGRDDREVILQIPTLAPGQTVELSFQVLITPKTGATRLSNQAFVRYPTSDSPTGTSVTPSDDPDTVAVGDPTVTIVEIIPTGLDEGNEPPNPAKPRLYLPMITN